jgi:hypothetical protein
MRVIEIIRDAEGGMKTHFTTLTKGLAEQGIDVTAICNFEERCKKDLEAAGIRVISFSFHKTIRPLSDCIAIFKLVSIIRKMKPDIVHFHGFKAGLLGRLAGRITGAKLLYTVHNFVTYGRGICTSLLIRYFESWMGMAIQKGLVSFWHSALLIPRIAAPIPLAAAQTMEINPKDSSLGFRLLRICLTFSLISS